jgi:hypothetical protein
MIIFPKGEMKLLTLFLFQRELIQLKIDYQSSADTVIKQQILKDIALLTEAINEMKEMLEAKRSMQYADDI